ncbi:uncharacterized protein LOC103393728 isoform X2 [Cynoglossus semilaevis]|uniref:uncharacterized protein LOC103393728 isoform X2 n=1 Tax=Cynoglossus semilaevis TaxID=244447 RepID=UPI000D6236C6|nr:uncharacterized protein LOC103393728 isoform X2 [Cynoglossus semilaevis]
MSPTLSVSTGSTGQFETWSHTDSGSSVGHPLHQPFIAGRPNLTENNVQRRRRRSTDTTPGTLPLNILTSDHLSVLRTLVSDKKITVRLGLHVSLTGPSEMMDPQFLLSLGKEPAIYNTGGKTGIFSMRVLEVKRVGSAP